MQELQIFWKERNTSLGWLSDIKECKGKGENQIVLNSYKVTSIRKKSGMVIFGSPQTVVDEGDLFRIAELHVISKGMIVKCEKEDGMVRLTMKNGEVIEIGVV